MKTFSLRGKTVSIHNDGEIFVNGNATGIKQWLSDSKQYSSVGSGSKIPELSGQDIESALILKGWL